MYIIIRCATGRVSVANISCSTASPASWHTWSWQAPCLARRGANCQHGPSRRLSHSPCRWQRTAQSGRRPRSVPEHVPAQVLPSVSLSQLCFQQCRDLSSLGIQISRSSFRHLSSDITRCMVGKAWCVTVARKGAMRPFKPISVFFERSRRNVTPSGSFYI